MGVQRVINRVHIVPMGMANAYLIEDDDGLTLIDAGFPNKQVAVFEVIHALGRSPGQLKHLIFTHGHPDHIGSAAAIVRETGARTYMHPLDIPMAESGGPFRPMTPAPGLLRQVMCRLFFHPEERLEPVAIDQLLTDGEVLPIAGGIEVIHVPGHCAGQVALLWRPGRMLFAGDVCMNLMGLADPVGFENLDEGRASQRKLANLSFDAAGFGHGKPAIRAADECLSRQQRRCGEQIDSASRGSDRILELPLVCHSQHQEKRKRRRPWQDRSSISAYARRPVRSRRRLNAICHACDESGERARGTKEFDRHGMDPDRCDRCPYGCPRPDWKLWAQINAVSQAHRLRAYIYRSASHWGSMAVGSATVRPHARPTLVISWLYQIAQLR